MKIPSPQECGLPEKFERWRPNQEDALRFLQTSQKRGRALVKPTGAGKSAVVIADALLSGQPTCIVTESRGLQTQLMGDFEEIGMVSLMGRSNYRCDLHDSFTCEDGYAARCPYKGSMQCPASYAEIQAASSMLVVTNYPKWVASRKYGLGMSHFKRVIFDEAHEAPNQLAQAMQVFLGFHEIEERLGIAFPSQSQREDMVNWRPWASYAHAEADDSYCAARAKVMESSNPKPAWVKEMNHLRYLTKKLRTLATAKPENWIVDEVENKGYQFDPIRPAIYGETALLLRIPSLTFVSATLRPKALYQVGLGKAHFDLREYTSDFPADRGPVYYLPTLRVDGKQHDLNMLWFRLDQWAGPRSDRNGIVQTVSFARRDVAVDVSRHSHRMMINVKGEAVGAIVEEFKRSKEGTIFVSPSVGAGYDFPGKQCEWQFLCKIPFPVGQSKIHKARQHDDPEYGAAQAMNKMVQIFGRGMRSADDRCENLIVDMHIDWFIGRYAHLAPNWFWKFWKPVNTLPPPAPKL